MRATVERAREECLLSEAMLQNLGSGSLQSSHLSVCVVLWWGWESWDVRGLCKHKHADSPHRDAHAYAHRPHAPSLSICIRINPVHWLSHYSKSKNTGHVIAQISIQMQGFWRHLACMCLSTRASYIKVFFRLTYLPPTPGHRSFYIKELSVPLHSHLFLSHTHPHPMPSFTPPPKKTYLMASYFIFNPRSCHVKLCICFIDVMTIASTILMMWWDWPSARQHSGTDEKTWLSDFLFSGSSVSACAPSCRVLYHYWQLWNIQQQVFHHFKIYLQTSVYTHCGAFIGKKMSKTDPLRHLWIITALLVWALCLSVITQDHCIDFCWITCLSHVLWACVCDCFYI